MHLFGKDISAIGLPDSFTNPFDYEVHPLARDAAKELCDFLDNCQEFREEIECGKMFGVLVVRDSEQRLGYLTAFSGTLGGGNSHPHFVPPIFDMLDPGGYFRIEEKNISAINQKVEAFENDTKYLALQSKFELVISNNQKRLEEATKELKAEKSRREVLRSSDDLTSEELNKLTLQSQHQKAEFNRLKKSLKVEIEAIRTELKSFELQIEILKRERENRSAALQNWLFEQFVVFNANGDHKTLTTIFEPTPQRTPPAGAGECAAPKLLQHAYINNLTPVAMAEFWWGRSPVGVIRHHKQFYAACRSKCAPILGFMLQGLNVENSKLVQTEKPIEIVYEDDYLLVIDKAEGVLSVPGNVEAKSVFDILKEHYSSSFELFMVHRLDMATSGLLIVAKNEAIYKELQQQFADRKVKKRYIALLENPPLSKNGFVKLPLSADYENRPLQKVDFESGKNAVTRYRIVGEKLGYTLIELFPLTGRTHQLRLHCAHSEGLGSPIVGDRLYGRVESERMYLHAAQLEFTHPISGKRLKIVSNKSF